MINLSIKFSSELDNERVFYTLQKYQWLKENNYQVNLPEGISESSTLEEINKAVKNDYLTNLSTYEKEKTSLLSSWEKYGQCLAEKLKICNLVAPLEYEVVFTSYGVNGSYHLPNKITINTKKKWQVGLLKTVLHEIIHLAIEEYIQKFQTSHWAKERIVDLTFDRFFPELEKQKQNLPINTELIDNNFNAFYPNLVKIIEETSR